MVLNDVFIRVTQFKIFFSKAKCCYDFNEQVTTKYKVVLYMPKTLYSVSKLGIHCNKIIIGNIQNYNFTNSTKKKGGKRNRKSVHQAKAATTSTLITSQTSKHTSHYL